MTQLGIIHLVSLLYISGIICLAISVNENRDVGRILRETLRRWVKFLGVTVLIGLAVAWLSRI